MHAPGQKGQRPLEKLSNFFLLKTNDAKSFLYALSRLYAFISTYKPRKLKFLHFFLPIISIYDPRKIPSNNFLRYSSPETWLAIFFFLFYCFTAFVTCTRYHVEECTYFQQFVLIYSSIISIYFLLFNFFCNKFYFKLTSLDDSEVVAPFLR